MMYLKFILVLSLIAELPSGIGWAQTNSINAQVAAASTPMPYLGVGIVQVGRRRAQQLRMPGTSGVEVSLLEDGSPADVAGLKVGDVITQYNGQPVEGTQHFLRMVRETSVGQQASMDVFRAGAVQTILAVIGARDTSSVDDPSRSSNAGIPDIPRSLMTWRSPMLGVEAESLSGQFAEFFGVEQGVLVRSVTEDSAAEQAGLRAGDVIQKVDADVVTTPGDITSRLRGLTGNSVTLQIIRNRSEQNVVVTF